MFGTRYEILRHVLREAEAYTSRIRGSGLQRVVPLKITNVAPPPPPLWICLSRPGQATRPNRAKKWKTINFGISVPIRGWQIALDQNRMENSLPRDFFTISDHRPSTYLMQGNRVFEGRNLNYLQRGEDCVWFSMINLKFPDTSQMW